MNLRMPSPLRNERGIGLVMTALTLTAFCALVAVAVDIGRITFTASEVQSAADVAALTGARALLDGRTPSTDAKTLLGANTINSKTAATAATTQLQTGTVDGTGKFTAGSGAAANAIQATTQTTVTNLFTGIFGKANASTTVTKTATAAITTTSNARPDLPLALSGSCFDNFDCSAGNCPTLNTQTNNAGWTGLLSGHSQPNAEQYIPGPCGGGTATPLINVGDAVNTTNGSVTSLFHDMHCLVCDQGNKGPYVLPVVNKSCTSNFVGDLTVMGFATVVVDSTTYCTKGHDEKQLPLLSVRHVDRPGSVGGCAKCGTGFVRLMS
jgi:Flp pilus assembly protein TadG